MRNIILQSSHLDGVQGAAEQQSEAYKQYCERAARAATSQSAKSTNAVAGPAGQQAGAVRGL